MIVKVVETKIIIIIELKIGGYFAWIVVGLIKLVSAGTVGGITRI